MILTNEQRQSHAISYLKVTLADIAKNVAQCRKAIKQENNINEIEYWVTQINNDLLDYQQFKSAQH
jgi:hypothetical protein